ncbi:MAG: cell division protein FtsQ/DivIB [Bacillota bacterium]
MQRKEYVILTLILVMIVATLTFINSNLFSISQIVVTGNNILSDQQVITLSGLHQKENIFQVNFSDISAKLLDQHQIEGVVLKRKLPATVKITINERQPLLVVAQEGNYLLVGQDGWVLSELEQLTDVNYPLLEVSDELSVVEHQLKLTDELQIVLNYLTAIKREFLTAVEQVKVTDNQEVRLQLKQGRVKLGQPVEIDYKMKIFNRIYDELGSDRERLNYINLKFYNNPVVQLE